MIFSIATKEDVKGILTIYNDAILNTTATFDTKIKTLEEMEAWFNNHSELYPVIVSKENDVVTGYCSLTQFKEKDAYKHTVELSVYIHPEHRRKGLARKLMEEIIVIAKELGHHTVISCITSGNDVSEKLHEKLSFKKVGQINKAGQKFNQWLDIVYYQIMI
jgi:L-amino acid N-acyltransferase